MSAQTIEIEFTVKVKYSLEDGAKFCRESARENLLASIENERQNGALTPDDISADWVVVNDKETDHNTLTTLDVEMSTVVGDYDEPDDIPEWNWVENNARFQHKDNGQNGIWDYMLNINLEYANIPEKLTPLINDAKEKGYTYILFNQGT